MILYYSDTSPYARKVRMLIIELGLSNKIKNIEINPFEEKSKLLTVNPLCKVPALKISQKESLFNSPLICRYLLNITSNKSIVPGKEKWMVYRWEALADGITDLIYNCVMEQKHRVKKEQSPQWINKWTEEIKTVLTYIESSIEQFKPSITLAHIAIASAIGYLELRLNSVLYENNPSKQPFYPNLLKWYLMISKQKCMKSTAPKKLNFYKEK